MEKELKNILSEEIKTQIQDLSKLDTGSAEKSRAVDDLATLYKLKIEEDKMRMHVDEKINERLDTVADRGDDERIRKEQLAEQIKDRYIKLGIAAAEIVLPLIFYSKWMKRGFKFEETGTFTSTTFRGLFNRFKPTKK